MVDWWWRLWGRIDVGWFDLLAMESADGILLLWQEGYSNFIKELEGAVFITCEFRSKSSGRYCSPGCMIRGKIRTKGFCGRTLPGSGSLGTCFGLWVAILTQSFVLQKNHLLYLLWFVLESFMTSYSIGIWLILSSNGRSEDFVCKNPPLSRNNRFLIFLGGELGSISCSIYIALVCSLYLIILPFVLIFIKNKVTVVSFHIREKEDKVDAFEELIREWWFDSLPNGIANFKVARRLNYLRWWSNPE